MYEIIICPLRKLYQFAEDGDMSEVAVLAVSSYGIRKDKLSGFCATHCMNFSDIVDEGSADAFCASTADNVAEYVRTLPRNLDALFVCCDSGESRSTAMAAAVMRYNRMDEMVIWRNPHYHPNPLVYTLLCEAFGIHVSEKEVKKLCEINDNALKNAIGKR